MPGGVRSRQPWLYLGADWAASDILRPEKEAEGWGVKEKVAEDIQVVGAQERGERPELSEKIWQ